MRRRFEYHWCTFVSPQSRKTLIYLTHTCLYMHTHTHTYATAMFWEVMTLQNATNLPEYLRWCWVNPFWTCPLKNTQSIPSLSYITESVWQHTHCVFLLFLQNTVTSWVKTSSASDCIPVLLFHLLPPHVETKALDLTSSPYCVEHRITSQRGSDMAHENTCFSGTDAFWSYSISHTQPF